ncbi:synaptotagmin-15B isoform X1 [Penaeus vannamei]|uniref:synaptotagmin-15B isoform X1 n=1 Tax=Penaeus vannamei TaxID=6689 RepID=UPI00387FA526
MGVQVGVAMEPGLMGGLVVGVSLGVAALLCTGLCLGLWCRRLRGHGGDPSPATFLVSKRKAGAYTTSDHPMAFVLPSIPQSDAGSEPHTPTPTPTILTPTERAKKTTTGAPMVYGRQEDENTPVHRWEVVSHTLCSCPIPNTPPPSYTPPAPYTPPTPYSPPTSYSAPAAKCRSCTPAYARGAPRPRSASPRATPLTLPLGRKKRPAPQPPVPGAPQLSPTLGGNPAHPPTPRPRSASPNTFLKSPATPTPPPRSIFMKRGAWGLDELREALRQACADEGEVRSPTYPDPGDVTTPDSIDGWGPVWTPASSIGSGGGCGLGELRVRVRYTVRTRLLKLIILSADNLPLRLGPEPLDTYTKAVMLPEKRVRFNTRAVSAVTHAIFNASFTHASRPSRLAHASLRFSVCQVTGCGRRVVVGYAAVPLSQVGFRVGLSHDLDTGPLTLHLQESAPDQQVGLGGQLQVGLSWTSEHSDLTISVLHLAGLQYDSQRDSVQVYVKVTVYTNNTILCWRRTSPRPIESEMTLFEEDLILRMPELDLDATHLVLSVRERTGPGCGRRVLGSCLVGLGGCVGEEGRHHWLDMLRAAPDIVVRTHPLAAHASYHDVLPKDFLLAMAPPPPPPKDQVSPDHCQCGASQGGQGGAGGPHAHQCDEGKSSSPPVPVAARRSTTPAHAAVSDPAYANGNVSPKPARETDPREANAPEDLSREEATPSPRDSVYEDAHSTLDSLQPMECTPAQPTGAQPGHQENIYANDEPIYENIEDLQASLGCPTPDPREGERL